jgi:hypothetical protein
VLRRTRERAWRGLQAVWLRNVAAGGGQVGRNLGRPMLRVGRSQGYSSLRVWRAAWCGGQAFGGAVAGWTTIRPCWDQDGMCAPCAEFSAATAS